MIVPKTCLAPRGCPGELSRACVQGFHVLRCGAQKHHVTYAVAKGNTTEFVYSTRGLMDMIRSQDVIRDWESNAVPHKGPEVTPKKSEHVESSKQLPPGSEQKKAETNPKKSEHVESGEQLLQGSEQKKAETTPKKAAPVQAHATPEKATRPNFGGKTIRALHCKNCETPRTEHFRNALCPDCTDGFRMPGRSRCEAKWTPDMKKEVAEESAKKRARRH